MTCPDIGTNFILTRHTRSRMRLRKVSDAEVASVLANPEQRIPTSVPGRCVYQSRIRPGVLLRVIVDTHLNPPEVVTVYPTTQIRRYWR